MEIGDKLAKLIRIPPLLITAFFSIVVIASIIYQSHNKAEILVSYLRENYTEKQQEQLQDQVQQFSLYINYVLKKVYQQAATDLQEHVETALDVANTIYTSNPQKSKKEVISDIAAALRSISFKDNDGSFFIYTQDGQAIMTPNTPEEEGRIVFEKRGDNGVPFVKELIENAQTAQRKLVHWTLNKPENSEQIYKKAGYSALFDKYGLIIGMEIGTERLQQKIQQRLQEWVWQGYSHRYNHLFVLNNKGKLLIDPTCAIRIPSPCISEDQNSFSCLKKEEILNVKEGFFYCNRNGQKVELFIKTIPECDWIIGAIQTDTTLISLLSNKISIIKQQSMIDLLQLLIGCLVIMGFVIWLAFYLSQQMSNGLHQRMMLDNLTDLPNRSAFISQVEAEVRAGKTLTVLNIDIDDFSTINERFNHKIGDQLLCQIVTRLKEIVADDSHLCRVAGDEFLLYFEKVIPCELGEIDVSTEISAVRTALLEPFFIAKEKIYVTCAIGAVYTGSFRSSINELLRKANIMLFRAKSEGKNRYSCYNSGIEKILQRDSVLERALVTSLSNNEIHLVYQPQVDCRSGEIYAVEALCRWTSEELGIVSPDEFIPVAEKNGFILPLGYYIFRKACGDIMHWITNGENTVNLSINISPRQLLHSNFVPEIQRIVKETGITPERITLEITENLLITDVEEVTPILEKLDSLGFDISLDDFGTGASSLTHVHHLPIKELKIDRSFVINMFSNNQTESLIKSILAVSAAKKLRVVAEGVETQEHVNWLKEHNCELLQGYFFSKPITIDTLQKCYPAGSIPTQEKKI